MEPRESVHGKTALEFARILVAGDYGTALNMVSSALEREYDETSLAADYEEMIEYGDGPPDFVDVMNTLEEWPAKKPGDIGWAYVAISGPGYSEGIAVVVCREGEKEMIREIEWGRP